MRYQLGSVSRLGNRRENQDCFAVVETPTTIVMVLGDGMSGHAGGELASRTLVESIVHSANNAQRPLSDPRLFFEHVIKLAQEDILDAGQQQRPQIEPRTTCVLCVVQDGLAHWAHVGDSRAYQFRNGKIIHRTRDHSQVEEMLRQGILGVDQVRSHSQRHIVTRCMGSKAHSPVAEFSGTMTLQTNDTLLLCTDGLWGALDDESFPTALASEDLHVALNRLAQNAELAAQPRSDNITAIAFRWLEKPSD